MNRNYAGHEVDIYSFEYGTSTYLDYIKGIDYELAVGLEQYKTAPAYLWEFIPRLDADISKLDKMCQTLAKELDTERELCAERLKVITEQRQKFAYLSTEVDKRDLVITEQRQELEAWMGGDGARHIGDLEARVVELTKANTDLELEVIAQRGANRASSEEYDDLQDKCIVLSQELEAARCDRDHLRQLLHNAHADHQAAEADLRKELESAQYNIKTLCDDTVVLQDSLDKATRIIEKHETEMREVHEAFSGQVAGLEKRTDNQADMIQAYADRVSELESKLEQAESAIHLDTMAFTAGAANARDLLGYIDRALDSEEPVRVLLDAMEFAGRVGLTS